MRAEYDFTRSRANPYVQRAWMRWLMLIALLACVSAVMAAPAHRSAAARAAFERMHPCPATGAHRGACPGHVIDHVTPLCAGGADAPSNMQWQTVADAKAKDRIERAQCHHHRRSES
jgi:hypothetical protein